MATSDSEDFESADEDLEINVDNTALHSVKKLKESEAQVADDCHDNTKNRDVSELISKDDESGEIDEVFKERTATVKGACDIVNISDKLEGVVNSGAGSNVNISNESVISDKTKHKQPRDRVKRQQKPRESKPGRSLRKLGTRISHTVVHACSDSDCEKVKEGFPTSEKSEKKTSQIDVHTHNNEGKAVADSSSTIENVKQELDKLSIEDGSQHDITPVFDKLLQPAPEEPVDSDSGWGRWGNWGVTSLLSTATEGVSTLTTHVTQGLSTALETGIGAPGPEELAVLEKQKELKLHEERKQNEANEFSELKCEAGEKSEGKSSGLFGFSHLMSGVSSITRLVETTGSKVLTGGLDTLETIGKKTMEVLQEGDPGLKKKRALFSGKPVLSQVLREAKEKAERENKEIEDKEAARKAHFETLFDDYQGLVHLEALEMLSEQCNMKLQSVLLTSSGTALSQLQQSLQEVRDLCQLPDDEDTEVDESDAVEWREKLDGVTKGLGVPFATDKLNETWDMAHRWLEDHCAIQFSDTDVVSGIYQKAIQTMAQLTAASVEQFHKVAELLLVKDDRSPTNEAQTLVQVTSTLSSQVSSVATRFSECLNAAIKNSSDPDVIVALITNVFLEASNSSSYIQSAFQLLIPVLEVGLTK
jgi:hypothetical protein